MIPVVCEAICQVLGPKYVSFPSKNEWAQISKKFYAKYQFPNTLGAIDGKHFPIDAPPNSGSLFYNYKNFFSLIMLATSDAFYRFTWVMIGNYGKICNKSPLSIIKRKFSKF